METPGSQTPTWLHRSFCMLLILARRRISDCAFCAFSSAWGLRDDIRTLALLNPGRGGFGGGHSVKIPEATDSRKSPKKIASVYPVIRPEPMPSAAITSYKPTSQD